MVSVKFNIRSIRFILRIDKIARPIGVTSKLRDGRHILMWDFDNEQPYTIKLNLLNIQLKHGLSHIYILQSSPGDNYIAYCFNAYTFQEAFKIVNSTPGVDFNFLRFSMMREYFTLRISKTQLRPQPEGAFFLRGISDPDAEVDDLAYFVRYETIKK
jgi:hypothetical protein